MFNTKSFVNLFFLVSVVAVVSANVIVNVGEFDDKPLDEAVDTRNDDVVVNVRGIVDGHTAKNLIEVLKNGYQCIPNGGSCQPDGSQGICCSGFCYKQVGWALGNCK